MPDPATPPPVRFTEAEAEAAWKEWRCNCGPGAIAAVFGLTLDKLRPHLGDFESKGYTNPTLMWRILRSLGANWTVGYRTGAFPSYGLARVQWEGPWTAPGVPPAAAYRHTHWIGACFSPRAPRRVFDINCMSVGGWIGFHKWTTEVVPWLLREAEPKASGAWHLTHVVEIMLDA